MKNINRRESPRIEIRLRCHVSSPALWMQSAMYTENISRSGVLIAWRGSEAELPTPSVGQIITVEIELPANHGFGQKCIHCQGTVIADHEFARGFPVNRPARELYGFPVVSRPDSRIRSHAAGGQFLDGMKSKNGSAFPIRREVPAVAGGLRLPHAHRVSLRAHERSEDAARRLRHGLAHPHRRVDSGQRLGADAATSSPSPNRAPRGSRGSG